MDISLILAAGLIALVGLPHGAMDPVIAHRVGLIKNALSAVQFIVVYLLLVAFVVGVWLIAPTFALIGFLLISAVHFGRDWQRRVRLGGFPYGVFILGLPGLTDPNAVGQIFGFLMFGDDPAPVVRVAQAMGIAGCVLMAFEFRRLSVASLVELALLVAVAWSVEPLWYFVIYFCGLHSPRHLIPEFSKLKSSTRLNAFVVTLVTTIATLALALGVGSQIEARYQDVNILIFQLLFIGLAALTVPHMCLIEWVARRGAH